MRLRLFFYLIFCLSSNTLVFAQRNDTLVNVIDEELAELTRLTKQISNRDPKLLVRVAELLLEKARLIRDSENQRFLSLPPEQRTNAQRRNFFKRSTELYAAAQKTALAVSRNFPKFKEQDRVFYILAFNAMETQNYSDARKFFNRAIKSTSKNSFIWVKSHLSLAELHYNEKEFKKAIPLYLEALKIKRDKWWTKDAYNLSWCFFQVKNYKGAIDWMKAVIQTSKDPKFVDISEVASRDLAQFYSTQGQTDKAIKLFQESGGNAASQLISLARKLIDQEKPTQAEKVLNDTKKANPSHDQLKEVYLLELTLFEKYAKYQQHLKTSQELLELHLKQNLDPDSLKMFTFQVDKMAATLQNQVVNQTFKDVRYTQNQRAELAQSYFSIKAKLVPSESPKALFLAAETASAAGNYNDAVAKYYDAYLATIPTINNSNSYQLGAKAVEGMIDALSKDVSKETSSKYLLSGYIAYLKFYPNRKNAAKVYQRVFSLYFEQNNAEQADKTLRAFKKNYPNDVKTQEAMLAKLMEQCKQKGDVNCIRNYVAQIKNGELHVSAGYAKAINKYLLAVQFESVDAASSKGQKVQALKGYFYIYNDPKATQVAKKTAAYNMSVLFFELKDQNNLAKWLGKSIDLMETADLEKFADELLAMSTSLFYMGKFSESINYLQKLAPRYCNSKQKNKNAFYVNLLLLQITSKEFAKSKDTLQAAKKCGVDSAAIESATKDLLKSMEQFGRFEDLALFLDELKSDQDVAAQLISPAHMLSIQYQNLSRLQLAQKYKSLAQQSYEIAVRRKKNIPLAALDIIASYKLDELSSLISQFRSLELQFPEEKFNKDLRTKITLLEKITDASLPILKLGSGNGMVQVRKILVESYQQLAIELINVKPVGKSLEFEQSFVKSMQSISTPLMQKANGYLVSTKKQIIDDEILSPHNPWFFTNRKTPIATEYFYESGGILMDRGGRR